MLPSPAAISADHSKAVPLLNFFFLCISLIASMNYAVEFWYGLFLFFVS